MYPQKANCLCVKRAVMQQTQSVIGVIHSSLQSRKTDLVIFGTLLLISTAHLLRVISYQIYFPTQRNVYKHMISVSLSFLYRSAMVPITYSFTIICSSKCCPHYICDYHARVCIVYTVHAHVSFYLMYISTLQLTLTLTQLVSLKFKRCGTHYVLFHNHMLQQMLPSLYL